MTYVMRMSTDEDILATELAASWYPVDEDYQWDDIEQGGINIPNHATIVVIAHGNNTKIGNRDDSINIDAKRFLTLIQSNMADGASPARIFISACTKRIAEFTARVRIEAEKQNIWGSTEFYGHKDPVSGPVPPYTEKSLEWIRIY